MLLEKLSGINSVSGNEKDISDFIISEIKEYTDEIYTDSMGNILAIKKGKKNDRTICVNAHMDEPGLIISDITNDGYLKFMCIGNIDERFLLNQRVKIGNAYGIIGIKAVHLQSKEEQKKNVSIKDMYIDIGCTDEKDAKKYVEKGDYASFCCKTEPIYDDFLKLKAAGSRTGCSVLMNLIKKEFENDILFCFCVQNETGSRGASVLSRRIKPDIVIDVDAVSSFDTPFVESNQRNIKEGSGPVIKISDTSSVYDRKLIDFISQIADENSIPVQIAVFGQQKNDSYAFEDSAGGCITACISIPCRYIDSPSSVINLSDYKKLEMLAEAVLMSIDKF